MSKDIQFISKSKEMLSQEKVNKRKKDLEAAGYVLHKETKIMLIYKLE